jgi:hypothetical protein
VGSYSPASQFKGENTGPYICRVVRGILDIISINEFNVYRINLLPEENFIIDSWLLEVLFSANKSVKNKCFWFPGLSNIHTNEKATKAHLEK